MNFLKRAFLSVVRNKGKSLILFVIVFILGNVIAGAIAIQQATKNVEVQMKSQLGAITTVAVDYESFGEAVANGEATYSEYPQLSQKAIRKIGENPLVKYYEYSSMGRYEVEKLETYTSEESADVGINAYEKYVITKGVQYAPVLDIEEGVIELTKGRVFKQDDIEQKKYVCLISEKLAEMNNLHVGDTIAIDMVFNEYSHETGDLTGEKYQEDVVFEIIGLFKQKKTKEQAYKDMPAEEQLKQMWLNDEQINTIYIPAEVQVETDKSFVLASAEKFPKMYSYEENGETFSLTEDKYSEIYSFYEPIYVLKMPEDVDKFKVQIAPLIPKYYEISTSFDKYESLAGPIQSMESMAKIVLAVAICANVLIVALVIVLFLRDRKHELGIYLSLGERKTKVMGQILLEVVAIALVAITLAVFTGSRLANKASDVIITSVRTEKEAEAVQYDSPMERYQSNVSMDDVNKAYSIQFTFAYVVMFYVVGLGIVLVSSIIPLIFILRLNPKKIMM